MSAEENSMETFLEKVKVAATDLRNGVCPIWQCSGELEYLEDRINWQEPDLKCKSCGATWTLTKRPT